jgi:hypothetical protein
MGWVVSVTSRPCFTPGEKIPGTHWTGGWVGPRVGLDTEEKYSCLCRGSNLDRPVVQSVTRHYSDWATHGSQQDTITSSNFLCGLSRTIISSCLSKATGYSLPYYSYCVMCYVERNMTAWLWIVLGNMYRIRTQRSSDQRPRGRWQVAHFPFYTETSAERCTHSNTVCSLLFLAHW